MCVYFSLRGIMFLRHFAVAPVCSSQKTLIKRLSITSLLFCAVLLASCSQTKQTNNYPQALFDEALDELPIPVSKKIVQGELDNGLRYYIRHNTTPENFAELRLLVQAGSLQEDDSQLGFAHFAEHMAFNGTEDFEKQEIIEYIESIGMQFGPHLNAFTSFDDTRYQLRIPTDKTGTLETGFHILENWAHKISFDPQSIDDERGVVLEEWRGRKGASERIFNQRLPIMMKGTKYADRMPIGSEQIILEGKHEDLIRYYKKWYRPDLMSVIAVGDFDVSEVEAYIKKYFSQIEKPSTTIDKPAQVLTEYKKPVISIVTDTDLTQSSMSVDFRLPSFVAKTIGDMRETTINQLAQSIVNARFQDIAWQPDAPFLFAGVDVRRNYTLGRNLAINMAPKPEKHAETFSTVMGTLYSLAQQGPLAEELEKQQDIFIDNFASALAQQDTIRHGFYVSQLRNHAGFGTAIPSLDQTFTIVSSHINDISVEDIQARLKSWLAKDDAILSLTAPENVASTIPPESEWLSLWEQVKTATNETYKAQVEVDSLMSDEDIPAPGSVIEKAFNEDWDAHIWTLSNGAKVVLKTSEFQENTMRFWASSRGGYSLVDDDTFLRSFGLMSAIDSFGLGDVSIEELNSYMQGARFSVNTRISTYTEEMFGETDRDSLTDFFQSMHLKFVAPRKDPERFEWLKGLYKPQISQRMNSPNFQFSLAIKNATDTGNPRSIEFDLAALENQDLDTIFDIRKRSFENAADFNFVFVGDLKLDEMEEYLSTYVASLPATDSRDPIKALPNYPQTDFVELDLPIGKEPKATVVLMHQGQGEWTPKNSLVFNALRAALENRLRLRLREELGGVYSVGVGGNLSRWPHQNYGLQVSFTCDPERIAELRAEVEQIFTQFIDGDIPEQALENFKTQRLLSRQRNLKENGFWVRYIMNSLSPYPPVALTDFAPLINSIEMEDLQKAAALYLNKEAGYFATMTPAPIEE